GTTELVKDLASDYTISDDGTVYTFTLRKGVKFQNGRELKASDVKYSLERTVNPKTQSPGAGFFSPIVGYDEMSTQKAEHLSGIEVVDDYTVK
ncbi:ABC transporter substrate-binding protein, partial [Salmonella enterica subsp. enterica serovar Indiana]|nr:ABC transporter substrate-binding protein [Salmonella enterica subsp. enterica serovar Indiana]